MQSSTTIRDNGFTLFELLCVVVLLGLLATVVLPRAVAARGKAAEKACYHNRLLINSAIERYAVDHGDYPASLDDLNVPEYFPDGIPDCPVSGNAYSINPALQRIDGHADGAHP